MSLIILNPLASLKITKNKLSDHKFLFLGAGEAALGTAMLLTQAMVEGDGVTAEEAVSRIFLSDSKGLLVKSRGVNTVSAQKQLFLKNLTHHKDFLDMVNEVQPTAILGASACNGAFTPEIIKRMVVLNQRPIIFVLSNPTSKSECTAAEAYEHSDGRAIFASGSPFPEVTYNGKTYAPGQANNAYMFPGVALGVVSAGSRHISENVFLIASETLAGFVRKADLDAGRLYPPLSEIQKVSLTIAKKVVEHAYQKGFASFYPELADKEELIRAQLYSFEYPRSLPHSYSWPTL